MCFPTWHLEAIRSRAARLALAERYLDIDISLDSFEEWEHGYPTVGCQCALPRRHAARPRAHEPRALLVRHDAGNRPGRAGARRATQRPFTFPPV